MSSPFDEAIASRTYSESLENSTYDDLCVFGKWLYALDDSIKVTPAYRQVKDLHYLFHTEAERIANQLQAGHFEQAQRLAAGEFSAISGSLIEAIREWEATGIAPKVGLPKP